MSHGISKTRGGGLMAAGTVRTQHKADEAKPVGVISPLPVWVPYLLALFFSLWSLRGAGSNGVTETDAARHAMNGAFIYDLVRTGHLLQPIAYAKAYYGRLPALSMPFHPPVFPAIEAVFFAIFGVNLLVARLAISLSVAICAVLLYRLIQSTLGSDLLAACVTVTTLSAWISQVVATDVMLEFPSLVFVLAALYCLRDMHQGFSARRALLFGILGATALWTKQHAVFLIGVPILWALFAGRWRMLFRIPLWISTAIIGMAVCGLVLLSAPFNHAGTNRISTSLPSFFWNLSWNVRYYWEWLTHNFLGPPAIFTVCSLSAYFYAVWRGKRRKFRLELYFAWIFSIPPVLLLVNVADLRYLIYLFPALIVTGYVMLWQGGVALLGEQRGWVLPAGIAAMWWVTGLFFQPGFLRGPAEAAAFVERGTPTRILYAGEGDGNFIFAARSLDPKLQTTVIPGDKLSRITFTPSKLEEFCRFYGVNWVIFEDVAIAHSWSILHDEQAPSMQLERSIPLDSSRPRWHEGTMKIYRFLAPREQPGGTLRLQVRKLGDSVEVKF
jgi:hypothetical protein